MAAASEDEDKPASSSGVLSATEEYEGDEGESYRDEEDDDVDVDDGFDETSEFENDSDFDEFDDEYNGEDGEDSEDGDDGVDEAAGAQGNSNTINGFDTNDDGSSDRLPRTRSRVSRTGGGAGPPLIPPQHNFAPPFYGRPPTPLPPSPSLTSLLRPSRPTTPDATDDELEPVPRAAPQVPTYEYYGFVLYLFSSLAFLIYLLWSYLPSPFLHALGIYYYPNRWWSLAIPSFLVMMLVYIYVALASYNTEILTLPLDSIETIVDGAAKVAAVDEDGVIVGTRRSVTAGAIQQAQQNYRHNQNRSSRALHADTIASWSSSKPFTHQREPSSPSPPLGKAVWRDRSVKSRDRKSKRGTSSRGGASSSIGNASNDSNMNSTTSTQAGEDGITMGRGRGWSIRSDSRDLDYDGNDGSGNFSHNHTSHRSPSDWARLWNAGTDAVMDIPLAGVCEVLYA